MKSKKIFSFVLASMIAFSAVGSASAAGWDGLDSSGASTGAVKVPVIDITLPTFSTGTVYFDIYNQLGTGKQVISPEYVFTNNSTVPVQIALKTVLVETDQSTALVPSVDLTADATKFDGTSDDRAIALYIAQATKDIPSGKTLGNDKVDATGKKEWTATADAKLFPTAAYGASGSTGTASSVTDLTFSKVARGSKAVIDENDTMVSEAIPSEELGSKNSLSIRFDGVLNPNGAWTVDEAITITPVFTATSIALTEEDTDSGVAPTITAGTPVPTSILFKNPTTGAAPKYTVSYAELPADAKLKTTLTAADYAFTSSAGTVDTSAATVTVNATTGLITFAKVKWAAAAKDATISFTLNPSAFVDPTGISTSEPVVMTLLS